MAAGRQTFQNSPAFPSDCAPGHSVRSPREEITDGRQVSIVKKTCFSNTELVTMGIQRVEKETEWTNPCIEGFRHIGSDVLATSVLTRTPFPLIAEI